MDKLNGSCFVCNRINNVFDRYISTTVQLYKSDKEFRAKYENCKGFCNVHYPVLLREAQKSMSGSQFEEFARVTHNLYLENMKPWKNSQDAIPRGMIKTNGLLKEDTVIVSRQS